MFDTIRTYLEKDQIGIDNLVKYCEPYLTDIATITTNYYQCTTGLISSGQKVSINDNGISFHGSLTKYYKGSNLIDLNPIEIKYAIEKLSDELHLPMNQSKVNKLDIGLNIETQYTADIYFPSFGSKSRSERHKQSSSLYYSNASYSHIIYDKIRELKKNKIDIPVEYKEKNITRIENRLKRLSSQFNRTSILLDDLTDKDFQVQSINKFLDEYLKINKISFDDMALKKIKTPNDFINYCASQYLKKEGIENVYALINQLKQNNKLKYPEAYSRLRKQITMLSSIANENKDDLISELNNKVLERTKVYLDSN